MGKNLEYEAAQCKPANTGMHGDKDCKLLYKQKRAAVVMGTFFQNLFFTTSVKTKLLRKIMA